jgi:hypothetical protein
LKIHVLKKNNGKDKKKKKKEAKIVPKETS